MQNHLVVHQGEIQFKDVSFNYGDGARLFKNKNIRYSMLVKKWASLDFQEVAKVRL